MGRLSSLHPVSFASADTTLDELADELRRSPRARVRARGLPVQDVVAMFFAEAAGRTGSR